MAEKKSPEFYKELDDKIFEEFMLEYALLVHDFVAMISKTTATIDEGKLPSKNSCYKMRAKTIDLEKFGKKFRERTLIMEKLYKQ